MLQKYSKWLLAALIVIAILLFTPIGGIVNLFVTGGTVIAAFFLFFTAILELLSFGEWGELSHWKGIGLRLAGTVGLLVLGFVFILILPKPPLNLFKTNDFCIETISNYCLN